MEKMTSRLLLLNYWLITKNLCTPYYVIVKLIDKNCTVERNVSLDPLTDPGIFTIILKVISMMAKILQHRVAEPITKLVSNVHPDQVMNVSPFSPFLSHLLCVFRFCSQMLYHKVVSIFLTQRVKKQWFETLPYNFLLWLEQFAISLVKRTAQRQSNCSVWWLEVRDRDWRRLPSRVATHLACQWRESCNYTSFIHKCFSVIFKWGMNDLHQFDPNVPVYDKGV